MRSICLCSFRFHSAFAASYRPNGAVPLARAASLQLAALCTVQPLCVRTGPLPFYLLSSILFAASLTAQVHLWRLLPFAPEDDCLFFSLLLTPQFFFCGSTAALGVFVYFFLIILALFAWDACKRTATGSESLWGAFNMPGFAWRRFGSARRYGRQCGC